MCVGYVYVWGGGGVHDVIHDAIYNAIHNKKKKKKKKKNRGRVKPDCFVFDPAANAPPPKKNKKK